MGVLDSAASGSWRRRAQLFTQRHRDALEGYMFLSPWVVGFVFFVGGPMLASLGLSLTDYDVISRASFVGVKNYAYALTQDDLFWGSLLRTFYYVVVMVPLSTVGSLLAALLLNQKLQGTTVFRTFFFLPHLTPIAAAAILWTWVFQKDVGPVNYLLGTVGIEGPAWLGTREWAIPSLIIMSLWRGIGGNRMMIFLAGLQGVPMELYEAAEIDGASDRAKFLNVTLPMISPTLFYNLVLGMIAALKVFALAFIATTGGPGYATWFFALHIYQHAFVYFDMGYACALAWIFFIILFGFTFVQFRSSARWVYYAGEAK